MPWAVLNQSTHRGRGRIRVREVKLRPELGCSLHTVTSVPAGYLVFLSTLVAKAAILR
jgi:hypothetical protein